MSYRSILLVALCISHFWHNNSVEVYFGKFQVANLWDHNYCMLLQFVERVQGGPKPMDGSAPAYKYTFLLSAYWDVELVPSPFSAILCISMKQGCIVYRSIWLAFWYIKLSLQLFLVEIQLLKGIYSLIPLEEPYPYSKE